jgi:neutral ceramidase
MKKSAIYLTLGFLLVLYSASLHAAMLKAGVAKVDITPPSGLPMWGYNLRSSTGTRDPLFARVLVLEVADKRVALVTLDLGRSFGYGITDEIRNAVQKTTGISYVVLAASHTHSGPVVDNGYTGPTAAWEHTTVAKIERAIEEAHRHAVAAKIGIGYGVAYIGFNRRRLGPDGKITFFGRNETQIPTSPIDPTVSVLRVDSMDGSPLAILVNYACHAVVFGPDNQKYSADYPGMMVETVEKAFDGKPLCFFLQGASGDINPYYTDMSLSEDAVKWRDWTGKRLGEEAVRVARSIHPESSSTPSLDFKEDDLTFHFRWNADKFHQAFVASPDIDQTLLTNPEITRPEEAQTYLATYGPANPGVDQHVHVGTILLDRQIAIMAVPGEAYVNYQINWRDRCPVEYCLFAGYANGYFGYFPTIHAATLGGYGAGDFMTWLQPGAGNIMVDNAVVEVYQMLGRLTDDPR